MARFPWAVMLYFCAAFVSWAGSVDGVLRTQTIALTRGWNAVFLEVYPDDPTPAAVFAGTPIEIAASYFERSSSAQFISNPGAEMFKRAGWGVWYSEDRPDAFLKTLHAIHGQQAYLLYAKSDFTWNVTGTTVPQNTRWEPGTFNFVGFAVHPQAPPTFGQFFAGSKAHQHNKIYRLTNGAWRRVIDPATETMRSGEAFWIFCDGRSTYQGPLHVETSTLSGLYLGSGVDRVILRNESPNPITPTVTHITGSNNPVQLAMVLQLVGTNEPMRSGSAAMPAGPWVQAIPPMESGGTLRLPFELRASESTPAVQGSLLKITTDIGTEHWVPVATVRSDRDKN